MSAPFKTQFGPKADIEMMGDATRWPHLRLPLKRRGADGDTELGILLPLTTRVWLCSMFDAIEPNETPYKDYQDLWAIQDDGWVVD